MKRRYFTKDEIKGIKSLIRRYTKYRKTTEFFEPEVLSCDDCSFFHDVEDEKGNIVCINGRKFLTGCGGLDKKSYSKLWNAHYHNKEKFTTPKIIKLAHERAQALQKILDRGYIMRKED